LGTLVDLAVILITLADERVVIWCQVTVGNTEIFLEVEEAVGFLFWGLRQLLSVEMGFWWEVVIAVGDGRCK
jgi:hypothetical protein